MRHDSDGLKKMLAILANVFEAPVGHKKGTVKVTDWVSKMSNLMAGPRGGQLLVPPNRVFINCHVDIFR